MTSDNQRIIIGLVGRKGSGKGTAAKILQERYGAKTFRFSDVLRNTLDQLFIEKSRENLVALSEALRKTFGQHILQFAMTKHVESSPAKLVVLDGMRRLGDMEGFEELGTFRIVSIEVPAEVRFERLRGRGENAGETTRTFESFQHMEMAPTEVTIVDVEARAWKKIDNTGSYDDLVAHIDAVMTELGVPRAA